MRLKEEEVSDIEKRLDRERRGEERLGESLRLH